VTFTVYGTPQPKGSARAFVVAGHAVVTTANKSLKSWESSVRAAAQTVATGTLLVEAVILKVEFFLVRPTSVKRKRPTTRPDLSKLVRGVEDALTGVLWKDDSQVVSIDAWKHYAAIDEAPRVVVTIHPCPAPEVLAAYQADVAKRTIRPGVIAEF
jgi:Holliday junction resolvase RusA-like endonuclease